MREFLELFTQAWKAGEPLFIARNLSLPSLGGAGGGSEI